MKKLLLTTLLATTLILASCTPQQQVVSPGTAVQENTPSEQNPVTETKHNLPQVTITNNTEYRYTPGEEVLLAEYSADEAAIIGEDYEEAAQTLAQIFSNEQVNVDMLAESAMEHYEMTKELGNTYFAPYSVSSTCEISKLDENILSLKRWNYEYSGGAHGYGGEFGTTIDLNTGEELELADLAEDSTLFMDICVRVVLEGLTERADELFPEYEIYVTDNLQNCGWYLDAAGVEFVFTPYEIGPYASGNIVVCVPYSELSGCMKQEYYGLQGNCVALVQTGNEISFGAGSYMRKVAFELRQRDEYDADTILLVDNTEYALEPYVRMDTAYLVKGNDKTFLMYSIDWASDDYETYIYDLTEDRFTQTANIWARLDGKNMSADKFSLEIYLNVLGSYIASMDYALNADGTISPLEEIFEVSAWSSLTTIKDLPVTIDGAQTTLSAGTELVITATDNEGIAWFETVEENGESKVGEIHYMRDEENYIITIDGVSEYDYFGMLPYAG